MNDIARRIRIGQIDFTNVWPIFFYFPVHAFHGAIELVPHVPTQLNRAMAEGDIAIGPISSFSYGEHADDYVLFPDLSVSAFAQVQSILLFHRKPLEQLGGSKVVLPTTSATSVNLLKIILKKFYGVEPDYTYAAPSLEDMMHHADAALLIGDDAIRASWTRHGYNVTDLAAEWTKHTGKWMTFAVWAIRKSLLAEAPEMVKQIYDGFLESKRKSLSDSTALVQEAQRKIGGTSAYWGEYFRKLNYDFGPEQWMGLSLYYEYAWELGLFSRQASLHIWNENTVVRVTE